MSTSELLHQVRKSLPTPKPVGCGTVRMFQAGFVDGLSYPDDIEGVEVPWREHAFHAGQRLGRRVCRNH